MKINDVCYMLRETVFRMAGITFWEGNAERTKRRKLKMKKIATTHQNSRSAKKSSNNMQHTKKIQRGRSFDKIFIMLLPKIRHLACVFHRMKDKMNWLFCIFARRLFHLHLFCRLFFEANDDNTSSSGTHISSSLSIAAPSSLKVLCKRPPLCSLCICLPRQMSSSWLVLPVCTHYRSHNTQQNRWVGIFCVFYKIFRFRSVFHVVAVVHVDHHFVGFWQNGQPIYTHQMRRIVFLHKAMPMPMIMVAKWHTHIHTKSIHYFVYSLQSHSVAFIT